jgi:predicted helicase
MINTYINKVASTTKRGDAREESYYSALAELLATFSETKRHKKVHVTVLPKKTEAGNPDFRVWDGKHSQVGYVEAKSPDANLDDVEATEQLKRYISTFPNLILTNFYEFRLYRHGQRVDNVLLARPYIPTKLKTIPPAEHTTEFFALLEKFYQFSLPSKFTAETLAYELATRTRFLRDQVIKEEIRETRTEGANKILGFYEAFQKHLIANLKPDEFADLYAQTITYGLFAARTRANGEFNRKTAYDFIPKTIGILREIFHFISFDPPQQLQATVDDIAEVLAVADVKKILHQYFREGKGSDPIFHFYETFLAEYNPEERERRGVYYTPEAVVSYIVRSLDIILKETFERQDGFATHSVTVLDPAGGTLTFLAEAAKLAVNEFARKYGRGAKEQFIKDHILEHFFAFELMMAPYAAGHLKMGYLLEELGHKLTGDERLPFYLTNTLEMEELAQTSLPGMSSLSEESHLAGKVKKDDPILVILGNPPYSGISANASEREVEIKKGQEYIKGYTIRTKQENGRTFYQLQPKEAKAKKKMKVKQKTWIGELIEYYKVVSGKWLKERNPKMLQDDYVKFLRFAQWKIDKTGEGAIGLITNRSYLENITFPGMRESLIQSFDELYILDLHGDLLRRKTLQKGARDENIFDITKGVAILLAFRKRKRLQPPRVHYAEVVGSRLQKYSFLTSHDLKNTHWIQLNPESPDFLFMRKTNRHKTKYDSFIRLDRIFSLNLGGVKTHRDHFVIDCNRRSLEQRIRTFTDESFDDEFVRASLRLEDTGNWQVSKARKALRNVNVKEWIQPILYRPFDKQFIFYHNAVVDRSRREVVRHMLSENLSLVAMRQVALDEAYTHFLIADCMVDNRAFASTKGIIQQFPLYLYDRPTGSGSRSGKVQSAYQAAFVFEPQSQYSVRQPNLNPQLLSSLQTAYKKQPSPEQIFHYIYAVLYSNAYRKKYAEFLKTDFPRVPFTKDYKLFQKLAEKGAQLVELHLLKSKKLEIAISKYLESGDARVVKVSYNPKKERMNINDEKYFDGVPSEVWEYRIGGYQVCEKWLKDRKGRTLSSEEIATYAKIVTAIAETIKIQESLDDLFKEVESNLLEVRL